MELFFFVLFLICAPGLIGIGAIWEFGDAVITFLFIIIFILLCALIVKFSKKE